MMFCYCETFHIVQFQSYIQFLFKFQASVASQPGDIENCAW